MSAAVTGRSGRAVSGFARGLEFPGWGVFFGAD